ncbi:MAG: Crp/Fnr family transcriptional regulator [Acidimicrobiia bacterium]
MPLLRRHSDKIEALGNIPIFRDLSKRQLGEVARHADEVTASAGEVLAEQGRLGNEFFLILKGRAVVSRNQRKIATLSQGDFFGEMSLIDGQPRVASVTAEDDSALLLIHRRDFSKLLDEVPGLARKILVTVSQRLREADEKLVS